MDLNYLYHRQQTELIRADAAASREARDAHAELASRYRGLIDEHKVERLRELETAE